MQYREEIAVPENLFSATKVTGDLTLLIQDNYEPYPIADYDEEFPFTAEPWKLRLLQHTLNLLFGVLLQYGPIQGPITVTAETFNDGDVAPYQSDIITASNCMLIASSLTTILLKKDPSGVHGIISRFNLVLLFSIAIVAWSLGDTGNNAENNNGNPAYFYAAAALSFVVAVLGHEKIKPNGLAGAPLEFVNGAATMHEAVFRGEQALNVWAKLTSMATDTLAARIIRYVAMTGYGTTRAVFQAGWANKIVNFFSKKNAPDVIHEEIHPPKNRTQPLEKVDKALVVTAYGIPLGAELAAGSPFLSTATLVTAALATALKITEGGVTAARMFKNESKKPVALAEINPGEDQPLLQNDNVNKKSSYFKNPWEMAVNAKNYLAEKICGSQQKQNPSEAKLEI